MNARILSVIALALSAAVLPAQAQTGEDVLRYGQRFPAVDARMTGLAGAGVAGVADWGATFANPAGLGLVRRTHVVGSLGGGTLESDAAFRGETLEATATSTTLGSAAYIGVVPVRRGSLVFGVGYNQTAGFDREVSFGTVGAGPYGDVFEEGEVGELSLVGAVEVAPRVLAGASINLVSGSYLFEQFLGDFDFPENGEPLSYLEADLGGANLRAGVAAEVSPGTRFGLAVETPTYFRIEESDDVGPFPDYSSTTPWRLSGGFAYDRGGLLLVADIEFVDWSQARLRPSDEFIDANFDLRRSYSEVFNTRFGAEYDLGPWAVRVGSAFQPDPLREEFDRQGIDLDRLRSTYTIGFSLKTLDRIALDVAYAYTEFEDRLVFSPADVEQLVVSEEVAQNRFVVGVRVDL